jgi:membrane protein YdbS with pleckstrin-like domain
MIIEPSATELADGPSARPLPGDDAGSRHQLPARTVGYWRVRALIAAVVVAGVGTLAATQLDLFTPAIRWSVVVGLTCYYLLIEGLIAPPLRRRIFWYAISADEIDLSHGFIVKTRTVIPMNRVQHLKMESGPIADRFRVSTLHIHTAAGTISMRALDSLEAEQVRVQIGRWARLADNV